MMMSATTTTTPVDVHGLYSEIWQNREEYIMFRIAKQVVDLTPELEAKGRPPLKLSIGAPTVPPPASVIQKLTECLNEEGIHMYSTTRGELFYRQAVADRMQKRFGVTVCPKTEVCSLVGSKEGLASVFRGLITPQLELAKKEYILVPDPGYASYVDAIEGAGGLAFPILLNPEDNYLPDLEETWQKAMAQGISPKQIKAVVINYPSNPIGATAPLSYYEACVAFAQRHGILLISDNAYADMYFDVAVKPHSILEVAGAMDCAIEFHSLSKPYSLTGWRLGFAVGNKAAVDLVALVKSTVDSGIFKVLQKAGAFAITDDGVEAHIQEVNKMYAHNQKVFVDGLKTLGWPVETMNPPKATFYLWMPIPINYTSCVQFSQDILKKAGIVTVPGTAFGAHGEGYVRLSLVLPENELLEVIDRMKTDGFVYNP